MKIGQTTVIVFISKVVGSAFGFLSTVYLARLLGAEVLGQYFLILAVVGWLAIFGNLGLTSAITKRISEDQNPAAYLVAGGVLISMFGIALSIPVVLAGPYVREYIGTNAAPFVAVLLLTNLFYYYVRAALEGQQLVHLAGILQPVQIGLRSVLQVVLAAGGFALAGLIGGYVVAAVVVGGIGAAFLKLEFRRPTLRHFRSLFDFAKYSWIGSLRGRAFSNLDILVLGAFVSSSLVGVYAVTWSIASFLSLFDNAIRRAMFPQMSKVSTEEDPGEIANLVTDSLKFSGLIIVPAFAGGILLGGRLLRIYGSEFAKGQVVLGALIAAVLLYGYQQQCLNALKGIDRPDITFYINAVFLVSNVVLNVILISLLGFVGAAIATLASSALGLVLAFRALTRHIDFSFPTVEIGRQILSTAVMAGVVVTIEWTVKTTAVTRHNGLILFTLVTAGAGTYFVILLSISPSFRTVFMRNLPYAISNRLPL